MGERGLGYYFDQFAAEMSYIASLSKHENKEVMEEAKSRGKGLLRLKQIMSSMMGAEIKVACQVWRANSQGISTTKLEVSHPILLTSYIPISIHIALLSY